MTHLLPTPLVLDRGPVATKNSERAEKSRVLGWAAVVSPACFKRITSIVILAAAQIPVQMEFLVGTTELTKILAAEALAKLGLR